jgi:hypothetical protein
MKTLLLLLILFPINLYAGDWKFLEPDDELIKTVVSLRTTVIEDGKKIQPSVTGVIIEKTDKVSPTNPEYVLGKILTCEHLPGDNPEIMFWNGKSATGKVFKRDKESDLMIIGSYIHKDVNATEVYHAYNPHGIVYGLGGMGHVQPSRENLRIFGGNRIGPTTNEYYLDSHIILGDSGSPIFYETKLVGIVSGGFKWFDREDKKGSFTWPLRTATPQSIRKFLDE